MLVANVSLQASHCHVHCSGFVEEMRFVAMKLHTRDQAPKEGGQPASPQPMQSVSAPDDTCRSFLVCLVTIHQYFRWSHFRWSQRSVGLRVMLVVRHSKACTAVFQNLLSETGDQIQARRLHIDIAD